MVCKNCGHSLYKYEDEKTREIIWEHENKGWQVYLKRCYVPNCKCEKPEPNEDDLND